LTTVLVGCHLVIGPAWVGFNKGAVPRQIGQRSPQGENLGSM
jgi:hypothetical protein